MCFFSLCSSDYLLQLVLPQSAVDEANDSTAKSSALVHSLLSGKKSHGEILSKVLDDEAVLGETDKVVAKLEEAIDTVADLAQNKTVRALLTSAGDLIPQDDLENGGADMGNVVISHLENLDIEAAVQLTEQTLQDLQDPAKRGTTMQSTKTSRPLPYANVIPSPQHSTFSPPGRRPVARLPDSSRVCPCRPRMAL